MDTVAEIQPKGQAINILENPLTNEAINSLKDQKLSADTWKNIAIISELPEVDTVDSLEKYLTETEKTQINQVTGLTFERSGRRKILTAIMEDVLTGNSDIAVLETDMNDLKGLNDNFGEQEADKAIRRYADWIRDSLLETISASGNKIKYAILNKSGEGSDSMKVIIIGEDLYHFSWDFREKMSTSSVSMSLTTPSKVTSEVTIAGEWGFYDFINKDIRKVNEIVNGTLDPLSKAGEIYNGASELATEMMTADKVRLEAELVNKIFNSQTISELENLRIEIENFGVRIPKIIISYYFAKIDQLSQSEK